VVGWAVRGAGDPLTTGAGSAVPVFAADALETADAPRAVVVTGDEPLQVAVVRRFDGLDLADGAIVSAPRTAGQLTTQRALETAVGDLVAGRPQAVPELSRLDVGYVVAEAPAASAVQAGAARIGGFGVTPSGSSVVLASPAHVGELTVRPAGAAATAGPAQPLSASTAGRASVTLPPAGARELQLAEPADPHWRATLDGRPLTVTDNGGLQAWQVPAGAGGLLSVGWNDPARRAALIVELVLVLLAVLGALPVWRLTSERDA
jgi:hypothetical protein